MIQQQFITFTRLLNGDISTMEDYAPDAVVIPVSDKHPVAFFVDIDNPKTITRPTLHVMSADLSKEYLQISNEFLYRTMDEDQVDDIDIYADIDDSTFIGSVAPDECFRFLLKNDGVPVAYSNMVRRIDDTGDYLSALSYRCKEPQFGFSFGFATDGGHWVPTNIIVSLPIRLSKPQFKQTDKIYEKLNGEQVVLYATINKEYEGETDYIPEDWHEKIVTALSCDEVYINNERVTKSDSYEIDQDNYTYSDCGQRLVRATFKVKTNVTQRNSNY